MRPQSSMKYVCGESTVQKLCLVQKENCIFLGKWHSGVISLFFSAAALS